MIGDYRLQQVWCAAGRLVILSRIKEFASIQAARAIFPSFLICEYGLYIGM